MSKPKPQPQKDKLPPDLDERKNLILDALATLHVTDVDVQWSGGGDSGQIDSVTAKDRKTDIEIDLSKSAPVQVSRVIEESVDSGRKDKNGLTKYIRVKKTVVEDVTVDKAIETFVEDLWSHYGQDGWWNNEGGYGDMQIDVPTRTMEFSHSNYREPVAEVDASATL